MGWAGLVGQVERFFGEKVAADIGSGAKLRDQQHAVAHRILGQHSNRIALPDQPGRNAALVSPEYRLPQIGMAPHAEYE